MQDFTGRIAVVTGGASGIGRALVERFAREGMTVVIADVEQSALDETLAAVRSLGARAIGRIVDVSDGNAVAALADETFAEFGKVNVLCNNAGVFMLGRQWQLTPDDWRWVLGVDLWGVISGIQAFLPRMMESGEDGYIVNTASSAAFWAIGTHAPYCVSKAGVVAMSECLFSELAVAQSRVKVSVLCPGAVSTQIIRSFRNRPRTSRAWGTQDRSEESVETFRQVKAAGIDPAIVADHVIDAIRQERFWILTHLEEAIPRMEDRLARIRDGLPPQVHDAGHLLAAPTSS
jgi:NAD(P)-dependent dehydrogenase (short-subunit alcohol dehydrogenase family)